MRSGILISILLALCLTTKAQYVPFEAYDIVTTSKINATSINKANIGTEISKAYFFSGTLVRIENLFENELFTHKETFNFINNYVKYSFEKLTKKDVVNDENANAKTKQKVAFRIFARIYEDEQFLEKIIDDSTFLEEANVINLNFIEKRKFVLNKKVEPLVKLNDKKVNLKWKVVDSLSTRDIEVFYTNSSLRGKANVAYYAKIDLKNTNLNFDAIAIKGKKYTPTAYYENNNKPILVINAPFFALQNNKNQNIVVKDSKILDYNITSIKNKVFKGRDTLTNYYYPFRSAFGIYKNGGTDIAWVYTDSASTMPRAFQRFPRNLKMGETAKPNNDSVLKYSSFWNVKTAIGGGPMLLQNGKWNISAYEERLFLGGLSLSHARTAIGYTKDKFLIVLVIEGRTDNAVGATLLEEAEILKQLGCTEALNLDGDGSSCMLINGKSTIKVSDKTGQREVPAVFVIEKKK